MAQLEEVYQSLPKVDPLDNQPPTDGYDDWLEGSDSEKPNQLLRTTYKAIEKTTNALGIKW